MCNDFGTEKSPGNFVADGEGAIFISVCSEVVTQFKQTLLFRPNNYQTPIVTCENSSMSTGNQKILPYTFNSESELYFDVPQEDAYDIKLYFMEYGSYAPSNEETGNTSSCTNPGEGKCYRWYKMQHMVSGEYPRCGDFKVFINKEDPNGFIGNCK